MRRTRRRTRARGGRGRAAAPSRRAASAASHAIASTKPAALRSVSPLAGDPGSRSKKLSTTKNASPAGRFRNATQTNATPTTAPTASVGERAAAAPITAPPRTRKRGRGRGPRLPRRETAVAPRAVLEAATRRGPLRLARLGRSSSDARRRSGTRSRRRALRLRRRLVTTKPAGETPRWASARRSSSSLSRRLRPRRTATRTVSTTSASGSASATSVSGGESMMITSA